MFSPATAGVLERIANTHPVIAVGFADCHCCQDVSTIYDDIDATAEGRHQCSPREQAVGTAGELSATAEHPPATNAEEGSREPDSATSFDDGKPAQTKS